MGRGGEGVTNSQVFAEHFSVNEDSHRPKFQIASTILILILVAEWALVALDQSFKYWVGFKLLQQESENESLHFTILLAILILRPAFLFSGAIIQSFIRKSVCPEFTKPFFSFFLAFDLESADKNESTFSSLGYGMMSYLLLFSLPIQILISTQDIQDNMK